MDVRTAGVVGAGAAVGGILRLIITQLVALRVGAAYTPFATLFINVSGSFAIGIVIALIQARPDMHPLWRYFLATGILGGYTTFSTFSFEALGLATAGFAPLALGYVVASVVFGIAAAFAGAALIRAFSGGAT